MERGYNVCRFAAAHSILMTNLPSSTDLQNFKNYIFTIRGCQVMLDRDLAELYGVETKVLNQAVKRNLVRFPETFRFQLVAGEFVELVTICDRFGSLKHSVVLPYAFTEQGIAMLSAVLRSETAINVSIQIMQAFVEMRQLISDNALLYMRLDNVERKQLLADEKFERIFDALQTTELHPKEGIFFDGQVFDAYSFVCNLVRTASRSIVLIDNYIDESVLTLLSKRNKGVKVTLYTKSISKTLALDVDKFYQQYGLIEIKLLTCSHDRFLILDNTEVYHIGASLKDLGKKWFAFSKLENLTAVILNGLE